MKYSGIGYLISEGFNNVFKNKKSTAISIVTMICAMFLFRIFFAIGENINSVLEQVQKQQGIKIFLFDFTTEEQKNEMEKRLKSLDGVNTVIYKTKEQALESFRESMKDYKDATEGMYSENIIFPASFEVTLTDLEKNEEIQRKATEIGKQLLSEEKVDEEIAEILGESELEEPTIVKNIESGKVVNKISESQLPYPSLNEIAITAFGDVLVEYHNELYGYIEFEGWKNEFKNGKELYPYKKETTKGIKEENLIKTEIIRHQIHHPENTLNTRFTKDELSDSICLMRKFILNNIK